MKKIILLILFVFGTFFAGGVFCGITYASHTNFKPYLKNLKKTIYSNWHPIKSENTKHTILLFKIGKDGSLLSLSVLQSSGSKEVDDCAIEAVKKSAPFEKLPEKFDGNSIAVEFTFDYHVLFKNSIDTKSYLKNLKKTIYSNWHPIKSENSKHTVLLFKIGKDGSLLSLSVLQSSGSKEVDDCAIEAVKKSAPFEKLPEKFDGNSIAVEFTFDYHVLFKNSTDTSKDYNEINVKEQSSSDYKDYNLFKQEPVRYNF